MYGWEFGLRWLPSRLLTKPAKRNIILSEIILHFTFDSCLNINRVATISGCFYAFYGTLTICGTVMKIENIENKNKYNSRKGQRPQRQRQRQAKSAKRPKRPFSRTPCAFRECFCSGRMASAK